MSRSVQAFESVDSAGNVKRPVSLPYGTVGEQDADAVSISGGNIQGTTNTNIATGLTAAGTSSQADALALDADVDIHVVSTTAANSGVRLPTGTAGMKVEIFNDGANTLNVYPATGGYVNGGSQNAAATLATKVGGTFRCVAADTWVKV